VSYQLGIDVGTTYTAAAVCRSAGRRWVEPEVVTLGTRGATVPSVLFIAPDGTVVVGEAAERRALTDTDRVVREFKRRIGDPTPIVVGGRAWAPEELSARLVRWVVDRVAEREGGPASQIALTHPASWGSHKKDLLTAALAAQGLRVSLLAEPQAAALHYATQERVTPGSTIAVYDLGGGTFDAAVVRKADRSEAAFGAAGFGLLGRPEGLDRLGGVDFDEVVFEHVRAGLPVAFTDLDDTDTGVLSAVARVRRECTEAKEALSADTDVSIPVLLPAGGGSVRLHRSEFESTRCAPPSARRGVGRGSSPRCCWSAGRRGSRWWRSWCRRGWPGRSRWTPIRRTRSRRAPRCRSRPCRRRRGRRWRSRPCPWGSGGVATARSQALAGLRAPSRREPGWPRRSGPGGSPSTADPGPAAQAATPPPRPMPDPWRWQTSRTSPPAAC
jgi:Hsp70 protein